MSKLSGLCAVVLLASASAQAVVVRHDVSEESYNAQKRPDALFDMRHQGHGVLVAPRWVVTAAHLIFYDYRGKTITLGDEEYEIEHVIFHEGYSKPAKGLFSGYSGPSQDYLRNNHDIALVKLKKPVRDIHPAKIYKGNGEVGNKLHLYGKGNLGTGLTGQVAKTGGTVLRHATNMVDTAEQQWLYYDFDSGDDALPTEGIQGDGDSGGPAFANIDGQQQLIGLVSWDVYDGDIADFKGGLYGMSGALVRLSYYADWIEDVQKWPESELRAIHYKFD